MGAREIGSDGKSQEERQRDHEEYRLENAVPGGFWIRFVASFIDGLIMIVLSGIGGRIAGSVGFYKKIDPVGLQKLMQKGQLTPELISDVSMALLIGTVVSWIVGFFYFGWFYKNKGASPGKLMLNLKVRDNYSKENLGYWRAFLREYIGKLISASLLMLGYIMAGLRSDKKALHDMLAGTEVVQIDKN